MVTLLGDRIPLAMFFQVARKRPSAAVKSWRRSAGELSVWPNRSYQNGALGGGATSASHAQPNGVDRKHDGPSLTRLRHIWYREAVERDGRYDSYYFVRSGEWVEPKCADPLCVLCRDRPERHPGPHRPQTVPVWLARASNALEEAGGAGG